MLGVCVTNTLPTLMQGCCLEYGLGVCVCVVVNMGLKCVYLYKRFCCLYVEACVSIVLWCIGWGCVSYRVLSYVTVLFNVGVSTLRAQHLCAGGGAARGGGARGGGDGALHAAVAGRAARAAARAYRPHSYTTGPKRNRSQPYGALTSP